MNETNDTILRAVDIVVNARLAQLKKDTTIVGTIYDVSKASSGKYRASYQNTIIDVYTDDLAADYKKDESIYITVPSGDMNSKKFILGRVKELEISQYVDIVDPNQQYELVGVPLENQYKISQDEIAIPGYSGEKSDETRENIFIYNSNDTISILPYSELYEYIQFSADFKYQPQIPTDITAVGNYGLEFIFATSDNAENNDTIMYVFDTESMYGNPYSAYDYTKRTVTLWVEKGQLSKLQSINLFSEGFQRSKTNDEIEGYKEIYVKNINISFAKEIDKNENYIASINTPFGVFLDSTPNGSYIELQHQFRNQGTLISTTDYSVNWFEQDNRITTASEGYSPLGGRGWKKISSNWGNNEKKEFYLKYNKDDNESWKTKRIKLVISYGSDIISTKEVSIYKTYKIAELYHIKYEKDFADNVVLSVVDGNGNLVSNSLYEYAWSYVDINGQLFQEKTSTTNQIGISSSTILSDRTYTCCVYSVQIVDGEKEYTLIDTLQYVITTKTVEALFAVNFITDSNGVFLYKENGYIELDQFLLPKQLGFTLNWSTDEEPYKYQWLIDDPEVDKGYVQPNSNNCLDKDIKPKNSMVTYQAGSTLRGTNVTENKVINYKIDANYNSANTANKIVLEIDVNDVKYYFPFNFSFSKQGDIGTNGTDYQMRIIPVNSSNNKNITFYSEAGNSNVKSTQYEVEIYHNGVKLSSSEFNDFNLYILEDLKNKSLLYDTANKKPYASINKNGIITVSLGNDVSYNSSKLYNILTVQTTQDNYTLTYHLPVEVNYNTTGTYHNFPTVIYDASGYNPAYYHNDLKVFYNGVATDLTYELLAEDSLFNLRGDDQNSLTAAAKYDRTKAFDVLRIKESDTAYINVPIMAIMNQYSMVHINDWDGNSVVVDNNKGIVYAPQIAAGSKDEDNLFTGVMLGEYVVDNSYDTEKGIGLWGFYEGASSFGFRADGSAYIGMSGAGRLEFNPDATGTTPKAIIQSGNYNRIGGANEGMLIDLTNGIIDAPGFYLQSDDATGNKFEFTVGEGNASKFTIYDSGAEKHLFYINSGAYNSNSSRYYLKSRNYGNSTGFYIDLDNGKFMSSGFTIDGSGKAVFSGELKAASGTFGNITSLTSFKIGGTSANPNFSIDDKGNVVIKNGTISFKSATTDTTGVSGLETIYGKVGTLEGNVTVLQTAFDNLEKIPGYITETYIGPVEIRSAVMSANNMYATNFIVPDGNIKVTYKTKDNGQYELDENGNKIIESFSADALGKFGYATGMATEWNASDGKIVVKATDGVAIGILNEDNSWKNYVICTESGVRMTCGEFSLFITKNGAFYQTKESSAIQLTGAAQGTAVFG